jgi:hypothetical protein
MLRNVRVAVLSIMFAVSAFSLAYAATNNGVTASVATDKLVVTSGSTLTLAINVQNSSDMTIRANTSSITSNTGNLYDLSRKDFYHVPVNCNFLPNVQVFPNQTKDIGYCSGRLVSKTNLPLCSGYYSFNADTYVMIGTTSPIDKPIYFYVQPSKIFKLNNPTDPPHCVNQ